MPAVPWEILVEVKVGSLQSDISRLDTVNRFAGGSQLNFPNENNSKSWKYFRAMVVNAAQLASYSQAKQAILGSGFIQVSQGMCNVWWELDKIRQTNTKNMFCLHYI